MVHPQVMVILIDFQQGRSTPQSQLVDLGGNLEDKSWEYTRSSQGLGLGHPSPLHEGSEV